MRPLEYKGYTGSIEYSEDDEKCLFGKVLGIYKRICILYEGNTPEELYDDFKDGIDHYLESCEEDGTEPVKPLPMLNIRIPEEIHKRMVSYAEVLNTPVEDFVCDSLEYRFKSLEK